MKKRYKATLALGIASFGVIGLTQPNTTVAAATTIQSNQYPKVNTYIKQQNLWIPKIKQNYKQFLQFDYRNGKGAAEGVVIHETANKNSTIHSEINYMTLNWQNAFVHAFVDKENIIQIHPADYAVWGAGKQANPRFYQIELVEHNTFHQFAQSVNNDAYLAAYMLHYFDLEPSRATKGGSGTVWTHDEVSRYLGGTDHTDPVGYFAQWGYTTSEFYALLVEKYNAMPDQIYTETNMNGQYALPVDSKNYGIWNSALSGSSKVGNLSAYDKQYLQVLKSVRTNSGNWYQIAKSGKIIGWVSASGMQITPQTATPNENAYNYGVWSNYAGGKRVNGLSAYSGQKLAITKEVTLNGAAWVEFSANGKVVGWVAKNGMAIGLNPNQVPQTVALSGMPVSDAYNYGIWSNYNGGSLVINLSAYANQEVNIDKVVTDLNGNEKVRVSVNNKVIGWVAKTGIEVGTKPMNVTGMPAIDAYNYGVWSSYQSGKRVSGLADYAGKEVKIIREATASNGVKWVQFSVDNKVIGWVAKTGIEVGVKPMNIAGTPVTDAYNYGVWDNYQSGKRVAGLSSYTGKEVTIIREATTSAGVKWVQFTVDGKVIGWVARTGIELGVKPVNIVGTPAQDSYNYGVWSSYESGKRITGLANYNGKKITIIKEATAANGVKWVQFTVDGEVIGWVAKQGIQIGNMSLARTAKIMPDNQIEELTDVFGITTEEAYNYGIWNSYKVGSNQVGQLAMYRNKELELTQQATLEDGTQWIEFSVDGETIGWVSKSGIEISEKTPETEVTPELPETEVPELEATPETEVTPELPETEVPESEATPKPEATPESDNSNSDKDIFITGTLIPEASGNGIWSNYTAEHSQIGELSNYIDKELEITQKIVLEDKTEWVEFAIDGKTVGWTNAEGIKMIETIALHNLDQEIDYKVWNSYDDKDKKVVDVLSNYLNQEEMKITQLIVLEDKTEWAELSVDNKVIGWIEVEVVK